MKQFKSVTIVGVGLIGGSVGLAIRERHLAERVVGVGRRQTSLRTARRIGAVTNTTIDLTKGVTEAELIVVASPVGQIVEHVRLAARHCPEGALITDTGSVKQPIAESLDDLPRGCRFLGSHPLTGGEKSGPAYARAELFDGHLTLLTPTKSTRAEDFDRLESFWSALGSVVVQMSPAEHDRAMAMTSHLPHAAAAVLAATLPEPLFRLAGSGFVDTTRLAAGSPELWRQILLLNRQNMLDGLAEFENQLARLRAALEAGDEAALEALLTQGKKVRDALGS